MRVLDKNLLDKIDEILARWRTFCPAKILSDWFLHDKVVLLRLLKYAELKIMTLWANHVNFFLNSYWLMASALFDRLMASGRGGTTPSRKLVDVCDHEIFTRFQAHHVARNQKKNWHNLFAQTKVRKKPIF